MPDYPRILIAAPGSGSGKTILTCALLRLLSRKGVRCRAFKSGPDFLDPMFHRSVLGIPSVNLDLFLAGREGVEDVFARNADPDGISVIEGAMGYFDGLGGMSIAASAWDLASALNAPVLLVLDCAGMSRSAAAVAKGFVLSEPERRIRGILLNRAAPRLTEELRACILEETGIPVIGSLPKIPDCPVGSRHLGLIQPEEIPGLLEAVDRTAAILSGTLDMERLLRIAREAGPLPGPEPEPDGNDGQRRVRIGVAQDPAFSFYYPENLRMLERAGAELVPFSPLEDARLPEVSGLLFGGGYPELHAVRLSRNAGMRDAVRSAAEKGMPVLAECGGFLYLGTSLSDPDGNAFPMAGVLPGSAGMQERPVRFGYCTLTPKGGDAGYLLKGHSVKAHEFHYYESTDPGERCRAEKPYGNRSWDCMQVFRNVMAGFPHLYYPSDPDFAAGFIRRCRSFEDTVCGY